MDEIREQFKNSVGFKYDNFKAVYAFSNTTGLGIYHINDEYVWYVDSNAPTKLRRAKIYTDTERAYFKWHGYFRIHLDECMRTNF